jgi:large subunit ribosomal protein L10
MEDKLVPSLVNQTLSTEITDVVQGAEALFVTGYQGLSVSSFIELRKKLRQHSVRYLVVKNSLARRVFKEQNLESLGDFLKGPSGIASLKEDPEGVSKILANFAKKNKAFQLRGAYAYGETWDAAKIMQVALLPGREELIARAVGQIKAPISGLVGTLSAMLRELVGVISAIQKKKEEHK